MDTTGATGAGAEIDLSTLTTESVDPRYSDLDTLDVAALTAAMNEAEAEVPVAVRAALPHRDDRHREPVALLGLPGERPVGHEGTAGEVGRDDSVSRDRRGQAETGIHRGKSVGEHDHVGVGGEGLEAGESPVESDLVLDLGLGVAHPFRLPGTVPAGRNSRHRATRDGRRHPAQWVS